MSAGLLAKPYRALTIGIVALISLVAFDYLAVATAMPAIARDLDGLSLYTLAFGGPLGAGVIALVLSGRWCDVSGPRTPLWVGIAIFLAGLLIAAAAPTMLWLVAGRLAQGLGGGLASVALYVIIGRAYPAELHPRIFAAFASAWVVPVIVGPVLTGWIVDRWNWRWVFLALAGLAVPAALATGAGLRGRRLSTPLADNSSRDSRRLVWAVGAAASVGVLFYASQQGAAAGLWMALALIGLLWCTPRLLPAGTLRARHGLPAVIALRGIASAAFVSCEVFVPLLLSNHRGLTLTQAGLVLTGGALGWTAGSWWQARRTGWAASQLLRLGMTMIVVGIAMFVLMLWPRVPLAFGVTGWIAAGIGMGIVYPVLSVLTLRLSSPAEQGHNGSALQLSDSLFSSTCLALSGAAFAALLPYSSAGAYFAGLGLTGVLAVLGLGVAGRTRTL